MKKMYKVVPIILGIITVLTGCGNKSDLNMGTATNPGDAGDTIAESASSGDTLSEGTSSGSATSSGNMSSPEDTSKGAESTAAEDPASEANATSSSTSEIQMSLFNIWEYEGYVDECESYTWREEFVDCDYDGDGKPDRVNRSWSGEKETATYKIEFGNGDELVTPVGWETGFPHIQSGDLDGDGAKEILVILTYDTSTDPYSFGDMWLFDRNEASGEYVEVELPLVKAENGGKGFNVDYEKPEDNKIRFTIREAGLSRTEEVDADYISNWWYEDLTTQLRSVFYAEILGDSNPVLRCYVAPLHRWGTMMGFNLNYVNGKYEVGYMEIDSPHTWEW